MKTLNEKEKKLQEALNKLENVNLENTPNIDEINLLKEQKNQLEIEKDQLKEKYINLENEYKQLTISLGNLVSLFRIYFLRVTNSCSMLIIQKNKNIQFLISY